MKRYRTTYGIVLWVWSYARQQPFQLLAVLGLQGTNVVVALVKPWPMLFLIDYILMRTPLPVWLEPFVRWLDPDLNRGNLVNWVIAATVLVFLLEWLAGLAAKYVTVTLTQRMSYAAAADLFEKLQALTLRFHNHRATGDIIKRVTSDASAVAVLFRDALMPVLASLVTLMLMFTIMWRLDAGLTLVALAAVPCMAFTFWMYARPMMDLSHREQEAEGKIYEFVERTFSAMPAVQAFGRERINLETFQGAADGTLRAAVSAINVQLQFNFLIGVTTAVGTAAIIWVGGRAVLHGDLTVGAVVLFMSYLVSLYTPLQAIMYIGSTIQSAGGSARRVLEIMQSEPEVVDLPNARPLQRVRGDVSFEGVTFEYEPGRPVLQNLELDVKAGQTIALVGPSGAGKSTLVSLIPRFYDPTRGRVLVDGIDLLDVQLASLRHQIAIVLQDSFLFPVTIAENIAYGNPAASMAQIENAARLANAHEFISRLPHGYETKIGERGSTLSGGERQRLSIARALLKDAPILILDEPSSALDASTEALMLDAMQTLMRGRTTIIVAHRLRTVRGADLILLLKDGMIAEYGTHRDLMRRGGDYARYVTLQAMPV
jgi:ATP-binding cassette, subfamily B, bacterial